MQDNIVTKTDPATIRLAVETLLPITEGADVRVRPADFPAWVDVTGAEEIRCYRREDGSCWLGAYGITANERYFDIRSDIEAPPEGVEFRGLSSGGSCADVTRSQLDYLTEVQS
jgi:hypothetical protein